MFLTVQGARIHLAESGTGVPTLFLHGIPDSGDVWKEITPLISDGCRCLVPDLPGFGKSAIPPDFEVTLDSMADFIDALITALDINEPINLVVHDIGGPYGLAWAVRHPEKVRRIVIMNTVFQSEYRWHRYGRICRTHVLGELIQLLTSQSGLARELRRGAGMNKPSRERISATYRSFTPAVRRMTLRMYRGLDPRVFTGWNGELRSLTAKVPSLVMWGDRDPYISSPFAERFGAQIVRHFPDCGHWPQLEIPDVVARDLLEFFGR